MLRPDSSQAREKSYPVRERLAHQRMVEGLRPPFAYVGTPHRGLNAGPVPERNQNGRTITSTTISTTKMPGTSFISRSARPLTGRSPAASFLP